MTTAPTRGLSTLDLLKTLAVALMIADHVGLYFLPGEPWLRILGRGAAVIFGFLIGFSGSTRVPASWVGLGVGLTLLHRTLFPNDVQHTVDILISLALTRIVMPYFERLHQANPVLLVPATVALAVIAEPLNAYFEYGSEVTMLALLGLAVRLDRGVPGQATGRDGVALVAIVAMSLIALRHFRFEGWEIPACIAIFAGIILLLAGFRRQTLQLPAWLTPLIGFCGRNTLAIYAVHLALFELVSWWITDGSEPPEE